MAVEGGGTCTPALPLATPMNNTQNVYGVSVVIVIAKVHLVRPT